MTPHITDFQHQEANLLVSSNHIIFHFSQKTSIENTNPQKDQFQNVTLLVLIAAQNPKFAETIVLKEYYGLSVAKITQRLNDAERNIYCFLDQAKKMAYAPPDAYKKRVNVYDATAHVFRHTFLTAANSEGVDLKTLQTIAGHSDSHTTMQVYVHPQAEKIQEAGNRMDSLLHNLAEKAASIHECAA